MIFKANWKTATSRKNTIKDFKRTIWRRAFDKKQNFLIESRLRKCYMTVRKKQIRSTNNTTLFQIDIMINESRHNAMIDFESENNYVSTVLTRRKRFSTRSKDKNAFEAFVIEKEFVNKMNQETISLSVVIQQHHEKLIFDLIKMIIHEVVLEDSWLKKHNPSINWETRVLTFERCDCVIDILFEHRQRTMSDEKSKIKRLAHIRKEDLKTNFSSSDIDRSQLNQQNKVKKESHVSSEYLESNDIKKLSSIYKKWTFLFRKKESTKALFKHQSWNHEIRLESEKQFTFEPIYTLFPKELKELRKYLKMNERKEFIRKSQSFAKHPILIVSKKNEGLRLCVDYRKLNEIIIKNRYSLFNIEEFQDRLQGAKWFIKLNQKDAYNLIRMKAGKEWKTAFRTRYDLYEYLIMFFELINASATCQKLVNNILREHLDIFVITYLDDILVYFKTEEKHIKHVNIILKLLMQRNLLLKSKKCELHKKEVDFLDFIVGNDTIRMNSAKVQAVKEWKTSINSTEVLSFIGFTNYNKKFIKGYFKKAIPLTDLTKNDTSWKWDSDQKKAFQKLKNACFEEFVLKMFDSTKNIRMKTDASDLAIEACILQMHNEKWHSVTYFSRKLTSVEQNYDIHDKKLLAIITALKQWRTYAEGTPSLTVYTNYKNLITFITIKQLNRKQVRWSELLGQYKLKIIYTSGKENGRVDVLNRRSDYMRSKKIFNHSIFKVNDDESLSFNKREFNVMLRILRDD